MMMATNLKFGFGLVAILLIYRIIVTIIMIVLQSDRQKKGAII